ncbi:MAG TPA: formylmethanofuran dehydrogenase [Lautropia sp.]|nr:formylmethanofuran dehydrogenase [Lautropia sp.]
MPVNPAAARTARALAHFSQPSTAAAPATIAGAPVALDDALLAAARMISSWRQPLFGGLGTDVAGARALTRLALQTGAILDHAHGEAMTQSLRAVQDRGGFTCTLSEIRNRADLIVCVGIDPATFAPDFFQRCGIGEAVPDAPSRREVIFLRVAGGDEAAGSSGAPAVEVTRGSGIGEDTDGMQVEVIDLTVDIHVVLAELNAACSGRKVPCASGEWATLRDLASRLQGARYAVLVHALAGQFPGGHAALLVETLSRIVKTLNRTTRAAAFALGSADGSSTVSQTATWLTGLPLRTALHARGFEHDPHRFGASSMLQSGAADGLLWVSSFSPHLVPPLPKEGVPPLVVLGHPAMAARFDMRACVFIAVSTPGVNAPGHLFRSDGGIVLALKPFATTELPGVADIAQRLLGLLENGS